MIKQYAHRTVVTIYPDMSRVVLSPQQKKRNKVFADAVRHAQGILSDPEKLRDYKKGLKPGERAYNHAIKTFLNSVKTEDSKPANTEDDRIQTLSNTEDDRIQTLTNTEDVITRGIFKAENKIRISIIPRSRHYIKTDQALAICLWVPVNAIRDVVYLSP